MKKFIIALVIFLAADTVLVSCTLFCPCGCTSGPEQQMDILGWGISTVGGDYSVVPPATQRTYDQVYKLIYVNESKFVSQERNPVHSPYKAVYACSPAPVKAIQTMNKIRLLSAVDATYLSPDDFIKAGDEITNRFIMESYNTTNFIPVDEFIKGRAIYDQDRFWLRLKDKPYQSTSLTFDIIITLSDGKVYTLDNEQLSVF